MLHKKNAFPKQIEKATLISEKPYRFLEAGDAPACDTKDLEELVVEGLAFSSLVVGVLPLFGKSRGANSYFVPAKVHRR